MSLEDLDINPNTWESLARDRPTWRSKVSTGTRARENRRTAKARMSATKARASSTSRAPPTHTCTICGRDFWARIGLSSYLRTTGIDLPSDIEAMVIFNPRRTPNNTIGLSVYSCPKTRLTEFTTT